MFRSIASTAVANIAIQVSGFLSGVVLARWLGAEGRGELAAVQLWPLMIAAVGTLGTEISLARRSAQAPERGRGLSHTAIWTTCMLSILWMVTGCFSLPFLLPADKHQLLTLARFALLVVPASMLNVMVMSIALGRGSYDIYNFSRLAFSVLYLIALGVIFLFFTPTVLVILCGFLLAAIATPCLALVALFRVLPGSPPRLRLTPIALISESRRFACASVAGVVAQQLPQMLLLTLVDLSSLGIFTIAYMIASVHSSLGNAMSKILFSQVAQGASAGLGAVLRQATWLYVFVTAVMMVTVRPLVPLVFGERFQEAAPLAFYLLPATSLIALALLMDEVLKAKGLVSAGILARILGGVTLAGVAVALIPQFGLNGMLLAVTARAVVEYGVLFRNATRTCGIPIRQVLSPRFSDLAVCRSAWLSWQ